jgi:hypothetical protein
MTANTNSLVNLPPIHSSLDLNKNNEINSLFTLRNKQDTNIR